MGITMSRQNVCYIDDPAVRDAQRAVSCVITSFRSAGHKNDRAIELAAEALEIPRRRVWALRYLTQTVRVRPPQRDRLLRCMQSHMTRHAAQLRAEADALERRLEAERLAGTQLPLPLAVPTGRR